MRPSLLLAGPLAAAAVLVPSAALGAPPAANVSVTRMSATPAAAAEGIRALVRGRTRDLVGCYDQELPEDREPGTQVELSFTVRGNGSTLAPRAEFPDPRADDAGFAFLACLKERVAGWTAAGVPAGASAAVALTFSRRAGSAPSSATSSAASPAAGTVAPQEAVGKVAAEHGDEILACYEPELSTDPQLSGKVTLRWTVQGDGSAAEVRVHEPGTTLRNKKVLDCMLARVGGWRFPPPGAGRTMAVTYPWTLRPERSGGR